MTDDVYDLTLPVHEGMRLYPGDPPPRLRRVATIAAGEALTASSLEMSLHVGTHVDAPAHFLDGGRWLSDYAAADFCGPAIVLDLSKERNVTLAALRAQPLPEARHVLLRTRNSLAPPSRPYDPDHAVIDRDAAEHLLARRPLSIGFDDYSVDRPEDRDLPVHRLFASAGLLVYVGLDLSAIPAGEYDFYGLPLRLLGVEAAPARVVAVRRKMQGEVE